MKTDSSEDRYKNNFWVKCLKIEISLISIKDQEIVCETKNKIKMRLKIKFLVSLPIKEDYKYAKIYLDFI